ncbi:MAG: hypothetical protein GAK30_03445 [Paracidovorax wautersii]|uniref:Calcium-binding protein n=1 Tax=Paracidovorax wautersii TaxID=1177982 RepID=A0A7V8JP32_9BURK|nr:MAG: hypothetical protein GAK30_03445 [Paracidovorax wautersii]
MSTPSLTDQLLSHLQGAPLQQIAQQIGATPEQTSSAVGSALPVLLGALGRNAAQPQGAEALFGALQRDHAGQDLGSVLGSVLGGGGQGGGASILGNIFGSGAASDRAQEGVGAATGLGSGQAGQLLALLAPIVLSFLANRSAQQGLDAGGLGQALGQEGQQLRQQGGVGDLLGQVLDQDGDGKLGLNDLVKLGGSLLGGRR